MKPYVQLCLSATLGLTLLSVPVQAVVVEDIPNPRSTGSWISDNADLLSADSEAQLNQLLTQLEADNGTEMTVVTVLETAPAPSPKAFTTDLFNYWGVGKATEDNGVVFMISEGDRRAEVVVGYGLESILTQSTIESLLRREAIPDFKQGNYDKGIVDASEALVSQLSPALGSSGGRNTTMPLPAVGTERNSPMITRTENQGFLRTILALGGGAIALTGAWFSRSPKKCDRCNQPLIKLDSAATESHLYKAQRVAAGLGSATYTAWQCPSCSQIEIKRRKHLFSDCTNCPRCQEPTVVFVRTTVQRATRHHSGQEKVMRVCRCCDFKDTKIVSLARLTDPAHSSFHGSSYGGSSGSSSGGGFGGGSSGGSGGGAGW